MKIAVGNGATKAKMADAAFAWATSKSHNINSGFRSANSFRMFDQLFGSRQQNAGMEQF